MARNFSTNQGISGSQQNLIGGLGAYSMSAWIKRVSGTIQFVGWWNNASYQTGFYLYSDNRAYMHCLDGATGYRVSTLASYTTGFYQVLHVFDGSLSSASRQKLFINGTEVITSLNGSEPGTTLSASSNLGNFNIGKYSISNIYSNGDISEVAIWNTALTADDAVSLSKGFRPVYIRKSRLVSYIPLVREITDLRSGISLTNTSSTVSDHPRIIY